MWKVCGSSLINCKSKPLFPVLPLIFLLGMAFCPQAHSGQANVASLAAEPAPYDSAKPLPHATLFAPSIISNGDYESHATFTPDGREMYFLKMAPNFSRWSIFVSRYKDGSWSEPEVAPFSGQYQDADPYITADGKHFYFISDRPVEAGGERQSHHDIWVMDKTESGSPQDESVRLADWSTPRHLPAPVNSDVDSYYPIALKNGTLYFGYNQTNRLRIHDCSKRSAKFSIAAFFTISTRHVLIRPLWREPRSADYSR